MNGDGVGMTGGPPALRSFSPQAPAELIGEFAVAAPADVAARVELARGAQAEWAATGAAGRAAALGGAARTLADRTAEMTDLIVREVGKPLVEARGEVARAVSILDYYAQANFATTGDLFPPSLGGLLYTERRPWGVAGLVTPWNFPLAIPLWKSAPALVAGNAVVLKPSPDAAACAAMLADILDAHLPDGLFSVVQGGGEAGTALIDLADVVSFTGSVAVGRAVIAAGASRGVPVQCEMGGQNAAIVLPDADPGPTAAMIAAAAMGYAGQKCTATRRVIVIGEADPFVEALAEAVRALPPAAPENAGTAVGPLINDAAFGRVEAAVGEGRSRGGRVLAGGAAVRREGWFFEPTLLDGLAADDRLVQEETFGPLAVVQHADDLAAALAIANGVRYGLVTSLHGADLDELLSGVAGCDSGLIKVNAPTTGVDFYAPFGGEKESSYGPREQGPAGIDFYSSTRTITVAPHRS
jgi:alpha-ketoglutaric semialdehyde dehydrogenase